MQSGGQSAGIQLQVGLDLAFFRQQLTTLGATAAGYKLPINVKFDRLSIQNELNTLGTNIKKRNYYLEVKTNLKSEIELAQKLATALDNLGRSQQSAKTGVGQRLGVAAIGRTPKEGGLSSQDAKKLYRASANAGLLVFDKEIAKTKASVVAAMEAIGVDAIQGLLNGLSSQDARLQAAAQYLGESLIKDTKTSLGIKSPSKEFEKIGKNVGEGFEKGALSSMDKAFDALERQLQARLRKLQGMMQPSASRRGAFPFVAKTGAIESQALMSESIALAQQLDQARAQIAQIQQRREGRLSFERASLSESAGRMLPASRSAVPMVSAQELVTKSFYVNMRNGSRMLRENFSANSYFPKATKALASAMDDATSGIKALPGARGPIAALPSTEMLDRRKFQSAMEKAAQIDAQNIALQQTARANATMQMRQQLSALPPISAPSIGSTNAPLSRAATYSLNKANQLLGLPIGPSSPLGSMGRFPMSGMAGRGSMGQFPVDPMLAVGGASAMGQKIAGPYPFSNTARSARGGYFPGISSSLFFPMSGMMGPSSPLGSITPQSSMFGAGGPPGGPPRPPSGSGGGMGGMGGISRALGGVNLPGAGVVREIGSEFAMAAKQVLLFGTAYKALAFATSFPAQVGEAVGALQSFNNTLKAISPSAEEARASNQFILDIVDRYNVPLQSARDGFTKLYASMAPAGFKGDEIRALFTGVSQAAATFGMSADKVDRVNYAFAQMASKGQVMSEELKGQLGDVLPGAMGIFAEAAGFTGPDAIQKFSKALEDGAYKGEAMRGLLKNVTVVLTKEFGPGAEGAARTFQGVINRMQNSTKLLYEAFEPVAVGFLNSVVVPLTSGIKTVADGFNSFFAGVNAKTSGGFAIAQELEKLKPTFEGIRANVTALMPTLKSFASTLLEVGKIFLQIAGNPFLGYLARVYLSVLPLTIAIRALNFQALIPLIASFLRAIPAFIAFTAATIQGATANKALQLSMQLTGQTAGVTAAQIRTVSVALKAAFASTVVLAIVAGIGMIIEKMISLGARMDEVRKKAMGTAESIRSMSQAEARQAGNQAASDVKLIQGISQRQQVAGQSGRVAVTPQEQAALERAGITTQSTATRGRGAAGFKQTVGLTQLSGAIEKRQGDFREAEYRQRVEKFNAQQEAAPASLLPIAGTGGTEGTTAADKAAEEAARLASQQQQNSIDAANRQNALNQAITEGLMALDDQAFQHRLSLIDARNNYELAGLNSIEARQEKFQQDLQKIELDRINTVRKAQQEVQKASLQYAAAQNTAAAAEVGGGGGNATFGDTGRTFNAPGWVHGHFQNMDREALVTDTVQVVMGLLQQGSAAELSSGTQFKQGMSQSQVERLVRQGIASHKQYASGASAIDVFVPKGTKVPTPLSGVGNLGGAAGVTGSLPRGSQLMHLDPLSKGGGVMQRREDKAGGKLVVEQQQLSNQQIEAGIVATNAANEALAQRKSLIASNINTIFPVAEQRLENDLMKIRNQLQLQGMPQEYIDYQESTYKGSYESAAAITRLKEETIDYNKQKDALQAKQAKGIALTPQETASLNFYTEAIKDNDQAVVELTEKQKQYQIVQLEGALAAMKNADALKAQQETMSLIKGSVESASSSYKGFMKEVAMGGDPSEALKKFQEAITDQVLTVFFDFAMKPVEDFFKNQLSAMFGVETEESAREKAIAKMEEQLAVQKSIEANVAKIAGAPAPGTSATSAAPSFTPGTTSSAVSTNGFPIAAPGGIVASMVEAAMNGAALPFETGTSDAANPVGAWGDSLNTQLSKSLTEATKTTDTEGKTLGESLGKAVGAVGMAAGAAMGIVAGISQIKEGGTSNVLGGIGSVLMSLGGAVGGFAGFFKGANGGVAGGGWKPFPVTAFANGGMVNGPTLGLVGEGKYNEAIVPLPDGKSIPVQMRGGGGNSGLREAMSGSNGRAGGSPILNMSFQSTNINGVEYVSRDQLEQAMAATRRQAASDGANRGMSMTLDKLQQSPSTRSRLGLGGR